MPELKPDVRKLPECQEHGHMPIEAKLWSNFLVSVEVPYVFPEQPGIPRGKQAQIWLCGRCGLAFWRMVG